MKQWSIIQYSLSIPYLSAVHSPTHSLLSLLFSPCLSFPLWRYWTISRPCEFNPLHSQHPLYSLPSLFCCFIDLIDSHNPDSHNPELFCLTVTWIKPTTTSVELPKCTPANYLLLSVPRNHSGNSSSISGGTGFLVHEPFTQLPPHFQISLSSNHLP